jgi:hypothetical protein
MTPVEVALLLVVVGAVAAAVIAAVRSQAAKTQDQWSRAANELGLGYTPGSLFASGRLEGRVEGYSVVVDTFQRSSGKSSHTYMRYVAELPRSLSIGLNLRKQTFFAVVASMFGGQDIEVGDAVFDDQVVVRAADERGVVEFLTPSRRLCILRLFEASRECTVNDERVTRIERGTDRDGGVIVDRVRSVVEAAKVIGGDAPAARRVDRALAARRRGDLDEALQEVRERPAFETPSADAALVEQQILETTGQATVGSIAAATALSKAVDDPQPAAVPTPPPTPPTPPEAAAEPGPEREEVCNALFGSTLMSLEVNRIFEDCYKGRRVRWEGKLERASTYYVDFVFGNDPGTKAVVELLELGGNVFGRTVQAILGLPPDAHEKLARRSGERIEFEGRLVGCDALVRNLYVADARVIS